MTERPVTVAEAAEYLHCSVDSVYELVADRTIPARKLAGKWLFFVSELEKYVRAMNQETARCPSIETRKARTGTSTSSAADDEFDDLLALPTGGKRRKSMTPSPPNSAPAGRKVVSIAGRTRRPSG